MAVELLQHVQLNALSRRLAVAGFRRREDRASQARQAFALRIGVEPLKTAASLS